MPYAPKWRQQEIERERKERELPTNATLKKITLWP
jgi:hypothetical protein